MRLSFRWPIFLSLTLAVLVVQPFSVARAQEDDEEPDYSVRVDLATSTRLAIEVAPLKVAEFRAETRGYGSIIAFDSLAQTDADLATAESAVQASKAGLEASQTALERARGLFAANVSVSRQTVEAAERQVSADTRQVAADNAQLALAQRKAISQWGQSLPLRNPADRTALLGQLTTGNVAIAKVTFSNGSVGNSIPTSLKIERVGPAEGATSWTSNRVWSAPADPTIPGQSFYALIDRARGLLPGERVIVTIPMGGVKQGVVIPSNAVVIAAAQGWYYERETVMPVIPLAPFYVYNRRMLDLSSPTSDGYFVAGGDSKQLVVVEGAGLLLARETGSDEDEE